MHRKVKFSDAFFDFHSILNAKIFCSGFPQKHDKESTYQKKYAQGCNIIHDIFPENLIDDITDAKQKSY